MICQKVYQFRGIRIIATRVRVRMDKQTNRSHKHFSTVLNLFKKMKSSLIQFFFSVYFTLHTVYFHIWKLHHNVFSYAVKQWTNQLPEIFIFYFYINNIILPETYFQNNILLLYQYRVKILNRSNYIYTSQWYEIMSMFAIKND